MIVPARFDTDRLCVRPLGDTTPDMDAVAGIASPSVTRHLPDRLQVRPGDRPDPHEWLTQLEVKNAVSAISDETGLVGFLTLHERDRRSVMIGYLFGERVWGRGFATELLIGLLASFEAEAWQGTLTGGVVPENAASARVLLKCGFARAAADGDGVTFYERQLGGVAGRGGD